MAAGSRSADRNRGWVLLRGRRGSGRSFSAEHDAAQRRSRGGNGSGFWAGGFVDRWRGQRGHGYPERRRAVAVAERGSPGGDLRSLPGGESAFEAVARGAFGGDGAAGREPVL